MKRSLSILIIALMLILTVLPLEAKASKEESFKLELKFEAGEFIPTKLNYVGKEKAGKLTLISATKEAEYFIASYEGSLDEKGENYNKVEVKTVGENSRIIVNDDDLAINGNIVIDMRK
ncbi:MAG: hypothetical protein SOZ40_00720 [Ezakiella sp.]|nr:hypothetical protein [Ezakiella sp.]